MVREFLKKTPASLLFLITGGLYLAGASPSIYGGDTGELSVSSSLLGIPHAPGYPLYVLLGKLFSVIIPWGADAYRISLLSSMVTALSVLLIHSILTDIFEDGEGGPRATALSWIGALCTAFIPILWDQAQLAEVFSLNLLMACACLKLFQKTLTSDGVTRARWATLFVFVFALGMGNHHTLLLLAPGFLFGWWDSLDGSFSDRVRSTLRFITPLAPTAVGAGTLGAGLYLYLPLRAMRHPAINFGDPHTWNRLWAVLTRKEFGTLDLHPTALPFRTWESVSAQIQMMVHQYAGQLGGILLVAGTVGIACAIRHRRLRPYLIMWFFCGPFFYLLSNMSPHNTLANWRLERFLLLPLVLFVIPGLAALRILIRRKTILLLISLALAVESLFFVQRPWFRWNLAFHDFGRNLCCSIRQNGLLIIDRVFFDEPTSCLLNAKLVQKKRPDVRVIYRPGTLFELFYGEDFLELPRDKRIDRADRLEAEFLKRSDRPLGALAFVKENLPDRPFRLNGLAYLADGPRQELDLFYIRRDLGDRLPDDYPTQLILVHYPYLKTKELLEAGKIGVAKLISARTSAGGRHMEWLQSNLGAIWSREGDATLAEKAFRTAVRSDPYFPSGLYGWGYVNLQKNNAAEACRIFESLVRVRPDWPEAFYMLGASYSAAGDRDNARRSLDRFLTMDPGSPMASAVRKELEKK
ncbi:MAG TPA: DUF2723 domain-containing protein [Elusimicrobiota bacterium]|nr:DUF2723 domain-containing protein [Elusimicrobiota bacterium]